VKEWKSLKVKNDWSASVPACNERVSAKKPMLSINFIPMQTLFRAIALMQAGRSRSSHFFTFKLLIFTDL